MKFNLTGTLSNACVFSQGQHTVKVETPNPLPRALWERLRKYVDLLEPDDTLTEE